MCCFGIVSICVVLGPPFFALMESLYMCVRIVLVTSRRPGGIEHISVDAVPHSLSVSPGQSAEFKCTALGKP